MGQDLAQHPVITSALLESVQLRTAEAQRT